MKHKQVYPLLQRYMVNQAFTDEPEKQSEYSGSQHFAFTARQPLHAQKSHWYSVTWELHKPVHRYPCLHPGEPHGNLI